MGVTVVTVAGFRRVMLRDAAKTLRLNGRQPIHNPQRPLPTTLGMALTVLYYHSNTGVSNLISVGSYFLKIKAAESYQGLTVLKSFSNFMTKSNKYN